jgi:hypothetical protein
MIHRRLFIRKMTGLGLTTLLFSPAKHVKAKAPDKKYFIHHVFFWLKNPEDPAVRKTFENALRELGTVETIQLLHIGKPADTSRDVIDNTYHYSFLAGFKDKEDHDVYQAHPTHEKFRNNYSHLWTKVLVYDSVNL